MIMYVFFFWENIVVMIVQFLRAGSCMENHGLILEEFRRMVKITMLISLYPHFGKAVPSIQLIPSN